MTTKEIALLLAFGLTIWILGTIYYAYAGPGVLETTSLRYRISFLLPVISVAICIAILRWCRISQVEWAPAMLLSAIPG